MRLDHPRVQPTAPSDWSDETRAQMDVLQRGSGRLLNIFRTLARHPKLMKRWMVFGNHVLAGSTLPARERELIILRTGYLCGSGYEWAQHVAIGRTAGVTDDEIRRLALEPDSPGWSPVDRVLLTATDQLVHDKFIDEPTWTALAATWTEQQLMDLVFTVGQYTLVSMALNTFGVQIEDDTELFPPELFRDGRFPG